MIIITKQKEATIIDITANFIIFDRGMFAMLKIYAAITKQRNIDKKVTTGGLIDSYSDHGEAVYYCIHYDNRCNNLHFLTVS